MEGLIDTGAATSAREGSTYRNGYRERSLDTRLGSLNLQIPKLRTGSDFPGFLEPRLTVEKALVAVIRSCKRTLCEGQDLADLRHADLELP
ncbi:hypothetical protein AEGHOMDF_3875 [Methylobacterium soli]|nr:hypothetical protein AEGHOMDF_3875 [Methylobacterium soli]